MPANVNKWQQMEESLRNQRRELIDEIHQALTASGAEYLQALAGEVHDRGDESVHDLLVDTELALVENHRQALQQVEEALLRIKQGEYGICCDCGDEINLPRLSANPSTSRCLACQSRLESYSPGTS